MRNNTEEHVWQFDVANGAQAKTMAVPFLKRGPTKAPPSLAAIWWD